MPLAGIGQSLQLADSLRVRGENFQERGDFKQAEFNYQKAYHFYETHNDTASRLTTGLYYAEVLSYRSKMSKAIDMLNELKSISHPQNDDAFEARIESDLGWIYNRMGDLNQASTHLTTSVDLAKQANDSLMIGYSLNNLAGIYRKMNNYAKALSLCNQGLPVFRGINNKRGEASVLSHIGLIYKSLFIYDKALKYYNRSLEITKTLDNVNMLGSIYSKLGQLQAESGNYDQALSMLESSLNYYEQANNLQSAGYALNKIGLLYGDLGQPQKALEYYRESLSCWKAVSNPDLLATSYHNMAYGLISLKRYKQADNYFRKSLSFNKITGNPRDIATSYLDLAMIGRLRHHATSALHYAQKARVIADSTGDKSLLRRTALQQGKIALFQDNPSSAIKYYKEALSYSQSQRKTDRLSSLKQLALAYHAAGSDSALYYGQKAIKLIEEQRSKVGSLSQMKMGYFKQYADFYTKMAAWQLEYHQDTKRAFHFVEAAKARSLSDELIQAVKRVDEQLPKKIRIERGQKRAAISQLYSLLDNTSETTQRQSIQDTIREKELDFAAYENRLHDKYPQYKQLKSPPPISVQDARQMCDAQTAILEYAIAGDQLLIFVITQNALHAKQIALAQSDSTTEANSLTKKVMQFRQSIIQQAPEDSLDRLSQPIYDQLIRPFADKISTRKNLIIIPDRYLDYLPFEALKSGDQYLIHRFNIKYAPALTGLSLMQAPRHYDSQKLLAIGNSSEIKGGDSTMALLPTVDFEIQSIANMFDNKTVLRDQEVTEEKVKQLLDDHYSFIHIAAHSMVNEQHSAMSGIMLDNIESETRIGEDGYLRSSEIYRLDIPSDMVVLSACKSGMGRMIDGEGLLGLQRAFFNAGTSTVVVSLWDVYDCSTTRLMRSFYQSLKDKSDSWSASWDTFLRWTGWDESLPFGHAASAMRKAKLQMLDSPEYHHPVYWAPFVVVGR